MKSRDFTLAMTQRASPRNTCAGCQGFMVQSTTDSQLLEITEQPTTLAWRCVNCGEWVDTTVTTNRILSRCPDGTAKEDRTSGNRRR